MLCVVVVLFRGTERRTEKEILYGHEPSGGRAPWRSMVLFLRVHAVVLDSGVGCENWV
jgi:hypothetical protein